MKIIPNKNSTRKKKEWITDDILGIMKGSKLIPNYGREYRILHKKIGKIYRQKRMAQ